MLVFVFAQVVMHYQSIKQAQSIGHWWRIININYKLMAISRDMYANVWGKDILTLL
ncbi:hypothetical protein [Solitalea lacus]|uniref:hypothetical protein n=1 Tax=Solitalea lacus TaxID=2911172 RepID=UPI001EDB9A81|nr:hypothetical protein [Solitalea lacus]UKJ09068.1 hypothetical protein L2B55_07850 [Solitalea lacus]